MSNKLNIQTTSPLIYSFICLAEEGNVICFTLPEPSDRPKRVKDCKTIQVKKYMLLQWKNLIFPLFALTCVFFLLVKQPRFNCAMHNLNLFTYYEQRQPRKGHEGSVDGSDHHQPPLGEGGGQGYCEIFPGCVNNRMQETWKVRLESYFWKNSMELNLTSCHHGNTDKLIQDYRKNMYLFF